MGKNAEKASPDWTKSSEDNVFRENTGFDWTKSNQASTNPTSSRSGVLFIEKLPSKPTPKSPKLSRPSER
ncbi:hypothetical protein [Cohnella massiliensis]|uniref:hypothetical protein n=1 Tax=Cohnella massiliensis TaxID=1816691 RepID=UPI001118FDFD|nr:hypothetical protein [Cohnella massiliensis]